MAVLQRDKGTVYGLNADLLALATADITEKNRAEAEELAIITAAAAEKNRAEAAELVLTNGLSDEVGDRIAAVSSAEASRLSGDNVLSGRLDTIEGADTVVGSVAKSEKDAKAYADSITAALADGRVTDLETLTTLVNADSATEGSFRKAIADVVGTAPEALDTLGEISAALANDPELDSTLRTLIATNITAAKDELKGSVSVAFDTLAEVETKLGELDSAVITAQSNGTGYTDTEIAALSASVDAAALAEHNLRIAAELAATDRLDIIEGTDTVVGSIAKAQSDAQAFATEAVRVGGAIFTQEVVTVTADKIVLAHAPKNGMIFNFGTVRHTDANAVSFDIPALVTATAGGKEFQLYPNAAGDFDTKSIIVQYAYTAEV